MKPLNEMTTEELTAALEALDTVRPRDTALRLALYLELRRAATEDWVFACGDPLDDDRGEADQPVGGGRG